MRSLSEIETTSKRASRAVGFSWGVSEEIGKSVRLLELFGFPGIKNLNEYFQDEDLKNLRHNVKERSTELTLAKISYLSAEGEHIGKWVEEDLLENKVKLLKQ